MKKMIVMATLLMSVGASAECGSISLGFVTIITGTTFEEQVVGYNSMGGAIYGLVEIPCSKGNRWQWFWE